MGHAITGGGFFNIDVEPLRGDGRPGEVFAAVIKFTTAPLTEEPDWVAEIGKPPVS